MGTTVASQLNDLEFYRIYRQTQHPPLEPVQAFLDGNLAAGLARRLGLRGPRLTVVNACSSGADAVGAGLAWLRAGLCDAVLAGGADELNRVPLCGFHSLGIMSDSPCAPFDRDRSGLNLGEGAGALLIETPRCARRRGAEAELVLAGYGAGCDAHHLTAPHPDGVGLELALRGALASAGVEPAQVAFVNAHGTATPDNDRVEGRVLARVFGPDVVISATKGYTGHTLGGAGAVEAVFAALALREGWLPASARFETPDPEIPVRPVRERTAVEGEVAVSTSLAFGGNNAALVLRRCGP
jgi:3-oxoacyl-(acyl-carrier-protein) synthase